MTKYLIIEMPETSTYEESAYYAFITRLVYQHSRYTGYKEIEAAGVDLNYFLDKTGLRLLKNGSIRLTDYFMEQFNWHIDFSNDSRIRYYLDTDIFKYEYDIIGAFHRRDFT